MIQNLPSYCLPYLCNVAIKFQINEAKLLNITPLLLLSTLFTASSAQSPVIVILPLASMYAPLYSQN